MTAERTRLMDNEFYSVAVEAAEWGVLLMDSEGCIQFVNRYAAKILDIEEFEYKGTRFDDVIVLVDFVTSERILSASFMKESNHYKVLKYKTVMINAKGKKYFIEGAISDLQGDKGDLGWIFSFRDVTQDAEDHEKLIKFSKAVDQLMSTVLITDRDFNIDYVNPRFHYLTGLSDSSVIGQKLGEIELLKEFHVGTFDRIATTIQRDGRWYGEIKGINQFDREYWLFINGSSIYNDFQVITHYVFIVDDVTDRKLYEIELRNERRRLEAIFKNAPVGMIFLNQGSQVVSVNEIGAAMLGFTSVEIIGHKICDFLVCDNLENKEREPCNTCYIGYNIKRAIDYGEMTQGQEFVQPIKTAGKVMDKWFKCSISPMLVEKSKYVLMIIEDITTAKETARVLEANEKRLRLITDNMLDLITQVDTTGKIVYVSPSHKTILGYASEDLIGRNLFEFIHSEDHEHMKNRFVQRIQNGNNATSEMRVRKSDGQYIWMEAVGNVVVDEFGVISIVYVSRDTTVKKQAEYESIKAREQAIEASKAKSQFLANMSHEIRTPLNGIIGMTNLTLMSDIHSEHRENLNMVKNSAITLLNIINDVLDFSKIEAGKVAIEKIRFNLYDVVHRIVKPLQVNALQKTIDLQIAIDPNVPEYVHGDPVRISQVLNNLIANGIKFTESGYVRIELTSVDGVDNDAHIQFSVRDSGIGIDDSDLDRIFRSFSQADGTITRKYGGTGLGLSISKMLVELMGGTLAVKSQRGRGSEFFFTVAFKKAPKLLDLKSIEEDISFAPDPGRKLKILVCEDEKINQKFIVRLLHKQGHEVDLAENGMEGIQRLQERVYDVVLMDIQMPVMDGISAVSVIRNELKLTVPVIAVTAYALKGDKERFINAGMNDYISKPIHIKEFYAKLDEVTRQEVIHAEDLLLQKVLDPFSSPSSFDMERYKSVMGEIRLFLDCGDTDMIEKHTHRLKSMFEEEGHVAMKRLTMKLELAARRNATTEALAYYSQLLELMNSTQGGA